MAEVLQGLSLDNSTIATQASEPFSVGERSDLAVATFGSLGLVSDKGALSEGITRRMQGLHDALSSDQLTTVGIEPFIALELSETFPLHALVTAFDKQHPVSTYVYSELWDQYLPTELNNRELDGTAPVTEDNGIQAEAHAMLLGGNRTDEEPGLYFTGKNLDEQRESVAGVKEMYNSENVPLDLLIVNPADYVFVNAQRREAGEPLLDRSTFTRFVQLAMKSAVGDSWVPLASSDVGQLRLSGSLGRAVPYVGVRLSVGQTAESLNS